MNINFRHILFKGAYISFLVLRCFEWVDWNNENTTGYKIQLPELEQRVALPSPSLTTEQHESQACQGCELASTRRARP